MPRVKLLDGRYVTFPDGTPPAEMTKAIESLGPTAVLPTDDLVNWRPEGEPTAVQEATAAATPPKSIGGFAANAIDSGWNLAKGTVEGAALIGKMGNAAMQGGLPYLTDPQLRGMMEGASKAGIGGLAKGAKEYFANRYGGLNEIGDTLYKDPFGVAADVATVASVGGGAAARAPGVVGRIGSGVARVGAAIDPMVGAARLGTAAANKVAPMMDRAGVGLIKSALNIPADIKARNKTVDIPRQMAEEGLLFSGGSQDELGRRIDVNENEIERLISKSTAEGDATGYTQDLRALADEKRADVPGGTLHSQADAVDAKVEQIFAANRMPLAPQTVQRGAVTRQVPTQGPQALMKLPIQQMHRSKVNLGKAVRQSFAAKGELPLNLEMMQAERRGAMKATEALEPRVGPVNADLGPRYALDEALGVALERQQGVPSTWWGAMHSPYTKTLAGRQLFRMGRSVPGQAATVAAAAPSMTRAAILSRLGTEDEPPE